MDPHGTPMDREGGAPGASWRWGAEHRVYGTGLRLWGPDDEVLAVRSWL